MQMTMSGSLEPMDGQKQTETYHGNGIRLDIEFGAVLVATFTKENEMESHTADGDSINQSQT